MTLKMHTGGLYLTNYVTSEGNWLHQILFRGSIANGVNTYCVHAPFFNFFLHFFETSYFFNFTSPIWAILCMSITGNSPKNQFKLQVVMQQNRKNAKGD